MSANTGEKLQRIDGLAPAPTGGHLVKAPIAVLQTIASMGNLMKAAIGRAPRGCAARPIRRRAAIAISALHPAVCLTLVGAATYSLDL
jgi:hypothetical protein